MPDQQWENLQEIFHATVVLAPHERAAYLEQACNGDLALRRAVESLIKSHEETGNFVDTPAYQVAVQMLVDGVALRSGQTVAHYRILSLLGEGGMGRVYLAEDTRLKRKVSLKFLSQNFSEDRQRVHRFEQEARAISALNHPNILTIHEIGEADGGQFIAAEFIDGETLRHRLASGLELDDAIGISTQVAAALVAAHRLNIVHRDIKPENIMIRTEDGLVKVLDFGLAKVTIPPAAAEGSVDPEAQTRMGVQTQDGLLLGTVAYMSPEQARGSNVDERTDIWSLGVVLYEMVTGCTPFIAGTSREIISAILSKDPVPPLGRYRDLVPERLEEIVGKAVRRDRDQRYQTSKDLLIDLKRLKQSLELGVGMDGATLPENLGVPTSDRGLTVTKTAVESDPARTHAASSAEYILNQVRSHKRSATAIATVIFLAIATGIFLYTSRLKHVAAAAPTQIKSLAVLPLKSLDSGENYLGIGIADAVIRKISQTGQLTVRPTSAVLKYVKEDTDSLTAARQLNADAILEGTVQHAGGQLRVTVNLLRTSDGASLYSDNFDLTTADVFAIQDKIAQQVASRLQVSSDAALRTRLNEKYSTEPSAYESYIRGLVSLDERGYGEESMSQMNDTIGFFKKAIEIDPKYALAHAQLAFAYAWTALFIEPAESKWADLARAEINQATDLNPNLAETHIAHALMLWSSYEGFQNAEAIRELRLARQLNPNNVSPDLPALYGHVGLDDLAAQELKRAMEINPTSQSLKDLTTILPYLREDADEFWAAREKLGGGLLYAPPWYYLRKGRLDVAQKSIDQRLPKAPRAYNLLINQGLLFALKGDFQEAQSKIPGILATVPLSDQGRHHSTYDAACIYALAGNSNEAVRWLKETAATGFPNYPLFERDPYLDRVRKAPEFVQFMAGQKAQWENYRQEFGD
jgi:serine/threonine-protein kinase